MSPNESTNQGIWFGRVAVFVILYAFWLVFSGHYDAFHLSLGVLCAALVSYFSHDLLVSTPPDGSEATKTWRFILYLPWLIYQVILANLHVVRLVFDTRDVAPRIVRFKTRLRDDLAQVAFANSITLTPGTITMDIDDDEFVVHAISEKVATDLLNGEMERRIAHVFMESDGR